MAAGRVSGAGKRGRLSPALPADRHDRRHCAALRRRTDAVDRRFYASPPSRGRFGANAASPSEAMVTASFANTRRLRSNRSPSGRRRRVPSASPPNVTAGTRPSLAGSIARSLPIQQGLSVIDVADGGPGGERHDGQPLSRVTGRGAVRTGRVREILGGAHLYSARRARCVRIGIMSAGSRRLVQLASIYEKTTSPVRLST